MDNWEHLEKIWEHTFDQLEVHSKVGEPFCNVFLLFKVGPGSSSFVDGTSHESEEQQRKNDRGEFFNFKVFLFFN